MFDLPVTVPESVVLSEKTERRRYGRAEKGVLSGVVGVGMSTASGPGGDGHHLTHRPANDDSDDVSAQLLSRQFFISIAFLSVSYIGDASVYSGNVFYIW